MSSPLPQMRHSFGLGLALFLLAGVSPAQLDETATVLSLDRAPVAAGPHAVPGGWWFERSGPVEQPLKNGGLAAIAARGAFTLELWVRAVAPLERPGVEAPNCSRIVNLASGGRHRNLALELAWLDDGSTALAWYVRTSQSTNEGTPRYLAPAAGITTGLQHVALTHDATGVERLYIDGELMAEHSRKGDLSNWSDDANLHLGGDPDAYRPFRGELQGLALLPRALRAGEIVERAASLPGAASSGWLRTTPWAGVEFELQGERLSGDTTLRLENAGRAPITWTAIALETPWLRLSGRHQGSLQPGELTSLELSVDAVERSKLAAGVHRGRLRIDVLEGEQRESREHWVRLRVAQNRDDRPGASTTGPRPGATLTQHAGFTIRKAGTVIDGVRVDGPLIIDADNVTVRNFIVDGGPSRHALRVVAGRRNVRLERGLVTGGTQAAIYGQNLTVQGVRVGGRAEIGVVLMGATALDGCWIDCDDAFGPALQIAGGTATFLHAVRIDASPNRAAAIEIVPETSRVAGVVIEDCWLGGGRDTVSIRAEGHGAPSEIVLRNNTFLTKPRGLAIRMPLVAETNTEQGDPGLSPNSRPRVSGNVWASSGLAVSGSGISHPGQSTP